MSVPVRTLRLLQCGAGPSALELGPRVEAAAEVQKIRAGGWPPSRAATGEEETRGSVEHAYGAGRRTGRRCSRGGVARGGGSPHEPAPHKAEGLASLFAMAHGGARRSTAFDLAPDARVLAYSSRRALRPANGFGGFACAAAFWEKASGWAITADPLGEPAMD